jgi:hypothetical protein
MVADLRSLSCEERTYRQSIHSPRDRSARACSIALAVFGSSKTRTHVIQVRTRLPQAAVDDAASGQARSPSHPKLASSQALHHSSHNNHLYHNNLSTPSSPHSHQASSVPNFSFLIVAMKTSAILLAAATAGSTTAAVHRMKLNKVPLSEQLVSNLAIDLIALATRYD